MMWRLNNPLTKKEHNSLPQKERRKKEGDRDAKLTIQALSVYDCLLANESVVVLDSPSRSPSAFYVLCVYATLNNVTTISFFSLF